MQTEERLRSDLLFSAAVELPVLEGCRVGGSSSVL